MSERFVTTKARSYSSGTSGRCISSARSNHFVVDDADYSGGPNEAITEGGQVHVEVWDEGPGLSAEDRDRAFEAFYSTKEEGTGLGLAIVQQIVAAHGGEVEIESEVGEGTTVRVRLPLAPEPPEL